jgi:hypothetical protein
MEDLHLFGPWFQGKSWNTWKAFLKALFALPPGRQERKLFKQFTGRGKLPKNTKEGWLIVGRRGGKSIISALVAVFLACFRDYREFLAPGEIATVMVIAADRKQARTVLRYINGFLDVPLVSQLVLKRMKESIELTNQVVIEIHTASFRATRGYTIAGVVGDEVAFWRSEDSANPDYEILNAVRPGMATIPSSLLLCLGSPYARKGEMWRAYRDYYGQPDESILVWRAGTESMNPTIPKAVIRKAYERDPAAAAAEYGAEFRRDIETFLSPDVVEDCMVPKRYELPPVNGTDYFAFVDPSGGSQDSMTLAIAHRADEVVVLDAVWERKPPFSPETVTAEFSELLKGYRIDHVRGDRYAGEWPREQFRKRGIRYKLSEQTASDLYREFLPAINSGKVELLDHPRLLNQLCSLERRTSRIGKDTISHPPGGHDDLANAVAGALTAQKKRPIQIFV